MARDCPYVKQAKEAKQNNNDSREIKMRNNSTNVDYEHKYDSDGESNRYFTSASSKTIVNSVAHTSGTYEAHKWYFDTGGNRHIVGTKQYFVEYHALKNYRRMRIEGMGGDFLTEAVGYGTCELVTKVNDKDVRFIIEDVMYVPNIRWNIFSPSKARKQGFKLVYDDDIPRFTLMHPDGSVVLVTELDENDDLYPINARNNFLYQTNKRVNANVVRINAIKTNISLERWHQRFGHVNGKYLLKMKNDELVRGLKITHNEMSDCEICYKAKQRSKTYRTNDEREVKQQNELIAADLLQFGPRNTSVFKYALVIVDIYSHFCSIFLMKRKDETNINIQQYIAWAERQTGWSVKRILPIGVQSLQIQRCQNGTKKKG